jgi:hypothetical protein
LTGPICLDLFRAAIVRIAGRCAVRQSVKVWFNHDRFPAHFGMDTREYLYSVVSLHGEFG